ncbi:YggS family pyridoxal phosphate-dependent enzyme [Vallicoccus soli]|uniref:Pyridoxal phosphate homeostasis protein n=1 Tax=Vallicoccus soli TaxID=2339232 RepID=A0A3A3Z7K2_9ACTN|nr:YggS family pyridoxal phosphate-dependent enzyme [Vallicoccus soli]RJK96817.1 YggS family pyridoxal phosphate-dependent enzyme [Vallicoccus soli]
MSGRREEVAAGLAAVEERVRRACAAAGRPRAGVVLVAVTKTWPASDVRLVAELGATDVGESRDQEAAPKHAECADLGLRWHFVGQLQTNKARSVAAYADVVHSVDRARLVDALAAGARHHGRTVRCLVQVALDASPGETGPRGGAAPADVRALADRVAAAEGLELGGVMAVAPRGADPAEAFAALARTAAAVRRAHPAATDLSAGMSGDLEQAVAAGATHLRVGSAVFGARPPLG